MIEQLDIDFATVGKGHRPSRHSRYAAYRKSDVSWLPSIPTDWSIKRLKFAVKFPAKAEVRNLPPDRMVSFVPMDAVGEYGGLRLDEARPLEDVLSGFTYFRDGDVVVAKITPCFENGKGALASGLEGGIGFGTTELHVMRAGKELLSEFLFYLTTSRDFRELGSAEMYGAGGQKRVPERFLRDLRHPIPPVDEQRAIVSFLDRETVRIDRLLADKTRLIDLLAENRAAVITHAVTQGLDQNAKMKPSGVDWLSQIPNHWKLKRLRFSMRRIEQGWSPQCDGRLAEADEWGVLKVGCVNGVAFDENEHKALPSDLSPLLEYEIHAGDILMSRANTRELLGSAAFVEHVRPRLLLCDKLYRIRIAKNELDGRFVVHAFRTAFCRFQFEREAEGASGSMKNIGQDTIKNVWMVIPPLAEQKTIVEYIAQQGSRFDALSDKVLAVIDRLREYRSALITAAVTGRIDVRKQGEV